MWPADSGGAVQADAPAITRRRGFGGVREEERGKGGRWLLSKSAEF